MRQDDAAHGLVVGRKISLRDPELYDEGVADEVAGRTQDTIGRVRRKVGNTVEDIGEAIKK
jgi:hypothetical protein